MLNTSSSKAEHVPVTRGEKSALERLVKMVKDRKDKPFVPGEFARFERELAERLRDVGREIVSDEMGKADVDVPAVVVGGVTLRRVLREPATYMSTFGPVTVTRTLFKDHTDPGERAKVAMEARLGIVTGFWTPEAAKQASWVVTQMTPGMSEELFRRVGNMAPSKSSLDRLPKELSARWEEEREAFEAELRRSLEVPKEAVSVAVSLDGVLTPMKDGGGATTRARAADEGRLAMGPAGYREVGCATISFCDEHGDMLSAIRMARMPEYKKSVLKEMMLAELAAIFDERPDLKLVKVADAAQDNWDFLHREIRIGKEAVDFYHAAEHLGAAVAAAYGDGTRETRLRFDELRDILLTEPDGVERVIRSLQYLRRKHPRSKVIASEIKFFQKNKRRMRYAELKAADLPIGSGPVEAACKTLVAQRMKQSGMRWSEDGGQAILTLRGWTQSDRFDHGWALLAATYQIEVTILDNVVQLGSYRKRRKAASE